MRVAVLQLNSQGMSSTKLYNYVRIAQKQSVKVLVLGEYILNPFFKELQTMSITMIKEQALHQSKILKELSTTYNMTIIAPLIIVKKKSPLIFKIEGFKFAIMSGFELHFDELFAKLDTKNIDCILLPSVSTFDSFERWKNLITTRAFTHNCYILRANRIGEYKDKDGMWEFYGDSLLASPNGEIIEHLGNREELMIVDMNHAEVIQARKFWGFKEAVNKRNLS